MNSEKFSDIDLTFSLEQEFFLEAVSRGIEKLEAPILRELLMELHKQLIYKEIILEAFLDDAREDQFRAR